MTADKTKLVVTYCELGGACYSASVPNLAAAGAYLNLKLPSPAPHTDSWMNFEFKFASPPSLLTSPNSWTNNVVVGQMIRIGSKGLSDSSLCKRAAGADENVVFQADYQWDPDTFQKVYDPGAIAVTCQEGAIAESLIRGYAPWTSAVQKDGVAAIMPDWQQSFIRMKTADYCGTGLVHTIQGTSYFISAPLTAARDTDIITKLEAIWGPAGAQCVNPANRRHPEIVSPCLAAIPVCTAALEAARRDSLMFDGIP